MNNLSDNKYFDERYQGAVAVIGMAGRFPGAANLDEYWNLLRSGTEAISTFSDEELLEAGVDAATLSQKGYVRAGGMLKDAELFDAKFFNFTPLEAEITDPQQRVFLEVAWAALEHAGYDTARYPGRIGIYGGTSHPNYFLEYIFPNEQLIAAAGEVQIGIGNDKDFLCSRVAYKLNLRGPALTVQTACSTSLVAVHLACQAILNGECEIAMAGGVSIQDIKKRGYLYAEDGISSPDGKCRAFDAAARGTVRGSGAGVVVLKSLADAINDGDEIHGVILGSAINNDGGAKSGFSAPSADGQASAVAEAMAIAGVEPDDISYIEAHGTGTVLGDPIELSALQSVFGKTTTRRNFCGLGSVKTNIGHLDAAAGIAGLLKTLLALKHRQLPASLHFKTANPYFDMENSAFYVNAGLRDWLADAEVRRAGVSSFGIGGTNAHLIVEEFIPAAAEVDAGAPQLLILSAKSGGALSAAAAELERFVRAETAAPLSDLAYTYRMGRRQFGHRRFLVANSKHQLADLLRHPAGESGTVLGEQHVAPTLVFMFPGQGSQKVGMGRSLYAQGGEFASVVDACCAQLVDDLGLDLRSVLFAANDSDVQAGHWMAQTRFAQPALFVIEYALARQFNAWGVKQQAMIGHSVGELVAACLAGVFSLQDALKLVAVRGRLMGATAPGKMVAVFADQARIEPLLNEGVSISAVNSPRSVTVAGNDAAVAALMATLGQQGIAHHVLDVGHAFHTEMMDAILPEFMRACFSIKLQSPTIPFVSGVTGTWITSEQALSPAYWVSHLRLPVRFSSALAELGHKGKLFLLELGPGQILARLAKQHSGLDAVSHATLVETPAQDAQVPLLYAVGQLWLSGIELDWSRFGQGTGRRVSLPTYPFERSRFGLDRPKGRLPAATTGARRALRSWFYVPSWKRAEQAPPAGTSRGDGCHLVFLDDGDAAVEYFDSLRSAGGAVCAVRMGEVFSYSEKDGYTINARQPADYDRLVKMVIASHGALSAITHCWNLSARHCAPDLSLHAGLYSLVYVARAFNGAHTGASLDMAVVANGLFAIHGDEDVSPRKAPLLSACKLIPLEYPRIRCRAIDLTINASGRLGPRLTTALVQEVRHVSGENCIGLRGDFRWAPCYDELKEFATGYSFRDGGHYVITGGLGGIGLLFAKYIAEQCPTATITLLGRSRLPEHDGAPHAGPLDTRGGASQLRALQRSGVNVTYLAADVAAIQDMTAAADVLFASGPVRGVFHAAGVAGGGLMERLVPDEAAAAMAAKVEGTLILERLFDTRDLDFFVLCSSLSAVAPRVGQVDYCAANLFLDTFAQKRCLDHGAKVIAVNWGSWGEVGMAVQLALPKGRAGESGQRAAGTIANADAPFLFDAVLSHAGSRLLVSPVELNQVELEMAALNALYSRPEVVAEHARLGIVERSGLTSAYRAPDGDVDRMLAEIWGKLFGIDHVGVDDNFFELGGHSLLAVQIVAEIRRAFEVDIPLRSLLELQTIAALSEEIERIILQEVEELSEKEALLMVENLGLEKALDE